MARGHALIVDDSSTARIILSRILERADIISKGVASAEEALTRLQNDTFDIIFLDHLLPGMDGFQALEKLKSQNNTKDIPVFMYTSQNAERYLQEAKARGAAGVIGKQVDRDQLLQTLDAILTGTPEPDESEALVDAVEDISYDVMNKATQSHMRRITGRLSTLEIAFEELDDEVKHLRSALARARLEHHEALRKQSRQSRWLLGLTLIGLFVVYNLLNAQIDDLQFVMDGLGRQVTLLQDVLRSMVDIVGR
ncbi:MAG: response regulator [Marinobacter sp.]|nr:response regulator [Marinobacter sp.]